MKTEASMNKTKKPYTYRCDKTKEEIIEIVVEHFRKARQAYHEDLDAYDFGKHIAMVDLFADLNIYENGGEEE